MTLNVAQVDLGTLANDDNNLTQHMNMTPAKRLERQNDAVVLLATMKWCAANKQVLANISSNHPDCELVLLFPDKQSCIKMSENNEKMTAEVNAAFDNIETLFVKRTFAWSTTKQILAPQFAADIVDSSKTSRGYVAKTSDAAYDNEVMQKIVDIVERQANPFNIEVYE